MLEEGALKVCRMGAIGVTRKRDARILRDGFWEEPDQGVLQARGTFEPQTL